MEVETVSHFVAMSAEAWNRFYCNESVAE